MILIFCYRKNLMNCTLHLAACSDNRNQILELLLSRTKVDVNICFTAAQTNTYSKWTALHHACSGLASKNIETLLAHGADICAKNGLGETPKQLAIDNNVDKELLYLLKYEEKV